LIISWQSLIIIINTHMGTSQPCVCLDIDAWAGIETSYHQ
jgi:hypothetical protein